MAFQFTSAIRKLGKMRKRIRVVPGGTSAGKTFGILPILIDFAARRPNFEISVVSESIPHLRKGALKDFIKIMRETKRWRDDHYNKSLLTYTFSNGSYIEFFSVDQETRVRGPRRNILYINEANNVKWDTYHQLAIRTSDVIYIDFNPTNSFWAHENLMDDPDAEWLTLTYKDNEALPQGIVDEIEKCREKGKTSAYWANWWRVYGLGELGQLEGAVFNNWALTDRVPDEARFIGFAIDFGFTNDPTAIVAAYLHNRKVIWEEIVYQKGLTNDEIAKILKNAGATKNTFIVADSAEPKSIVEINQYGLRAVPATKGADSIKFGIDIMQQQDFLVTKTSANVIDELRKYAWDSDSTGKRLNKPIDMYNHAIDAMRYLSILKLSKHRRKKRLKRRN